MPGSEGLSCGVPRRLASWLVGLGGGGGGVSEFRVGFIVTDERLVAGFQCGGDVGIGSSCRWLHAGKLCGRSRGYVISVDIIA